LHPDAARLPGAGPAAGGRGRHRRLAVHQGGQALRRDGAQAGDRPVPGAHPARPLPGRTHPGPGRRRPARPVALHRPGAPGVGDHRVPDHPLHRRGGGRRPRLPDQPRPDRAVLPSGADEAPSRGGHPGGRLRRVPAPGRAGPDRHRRCESGGDRMSAAMAAGALQPTMSRFAREVNAVVAVAARDITVTLKSPGALVMSLVMPLMMMGMIGGNLLENMAGGLGFELGEFMLVGMLVMMLFMMTTMGMVSLVDDSDDNYST